MHSFFLCVLLAILFPVTGALGTMNQERSHRIHLSFDNPMSWADDVTVWGLENAIRWEILDGGKEGKALRISALPDKISSCYEVRTIQINHKPKTSARISFDIKANSLPEGASFAIRYFDGYCTAQPFASIADEQFRPFPAPLWKSSKSSIGRIWKHITLNTETLDNTVLTLALVVRQDPQEKGSELKRFLDVMLDNLTIEVQPLETLMDPGFDWHGISGGTTTHFRFSTRAAASDWCDFADQEDVQYWNGQTIHYTLLQFREASINKNGGGGHNLVHEVCSSDLGGLSVVAMKRPDAGRSSAVSWGVRQTVAYSSLGLKIDQAAKLRIKMKITSDDFRDLNFSRVQLGVDPNGGIDTHLAQWTQESLTILQKGGWDIATLEFDKPAGAQAFTVYFRHRDGVPGGPERTYTFAEKQTRGSPYGCAAYADWVLVEVL